MSWLGRALAAVGTLILLLLAWVWFFPGWDAEQHASLSVDTAQPIAARELLRVARKRGEVLPDEVLLGVPCLVSREETPKNKHYVFEFHRRQASPRVVSVFVSSSPSQLDSEMTGNTATMPDGTPMWTNPVRHCGKTTGGADLAQ